ncbi:MAG: glycosyl transferase family 1 [Rhodocyclaceae bacterium]|nr:glycosyl transferase family 1 [Rhodocyclaceae bacterium]
MNILVVGESVTLAHQARAMVVAEWLAAQTHCRVTLAETWPLSAQATFLPGPTRIQIPGISPARFKQALAAGRPVYSAVDIQSYIQDDLALFEQVRPDLVIGDFRLSLSSSARMVGVRYATITNAYWCPTSQAGYPMPVLPWTGLLPLWLEESLFGLGLRLAMPAHCRAVNAARSAASLGSLGHDLRRVYTDADTVLIADPPGLFELGRLPSTHHFLGPILWAPKVDLPVWWNEVPVTGPVAYVALGSSGPHDALGQVLQALTGAGWFALAASAGAESSTLHLPNARLAHFCQWQINCRADVVICNGGNAGCQQALVCQQAGARHRQQHGSVHEHGWHCCLRRRNLSSGRSLDA